ncbi:MAG: hypothetical protein U1D67_07535 [Dehalococcoidia bacterium]|nr:hypothetical protein [Dehalococcoidia bacterium]
MFGSEYFWEIVLMLGMIAIFIGLAFLPPKRKAKKSAGGKRA